MASFNLVPSGQTNLTLEHISLSLGSNAQAAAVNFNTTQFRIDGSGSNVMLSLNLEPGVFGPRWRRRSKVVKFKA